MDNQKIKEALDALSEVICKEGLDAVKDLVVGMGYVEPFTIEDGVYVALDVSEYGKPKSRIFCKTGKSFVDYRGDTRMEYDATTVAAFKKGKYLKLHLRSGDSVTINGHTFKG